MWFIRFIRSPLGRTLKVLAGVWCFSVGSVQYSLDGLLLMMLAVLLGATAIANVCIVEEAINAWRTGHGGPPLPRHS